MEFKRHPDYPKYRIYKNGDVYREWKSKDKLLKHSLGNHGYYFVGLSNGGKEKRFLIHRLLAMLFIPNLSLKKEVDHINRVPTDNRLENLRWMDRGGQQLNRVFKENNTGYSFITKRKRKSNTSGFCFHCQIQRNRKYVLNTGRAKLEDAVELVRQTLIDNMWIFDGLPEESINTIKEKYNLHEIV